VVANSVNFDGYSWKTLTKEHILSSNFVLEGRSTAQAVSRRLPTAEARVRAQIRWDVMEKVALRQDFSEYFGFPCKFSLH
jgi:hypothetical protein